MAATATKEQAREQLNSIVAGLASRQAEAPRPAGQGLAAAQHARVRPVVVEHGLQVRHHLGRLTVVPVV